MRLPDLTMPVDRGQCGTLATLRGVDIYLRYAGPNPLRFGELLPAEYRTPAPAVRYAPKG